MFFIRCLCLFVASALLSVWPETAATAPTYDVQAQRQRFLDAERELRSGAGPRYRALRAQLDEYPLTIYLDYEQLRDRLRRTTEQQANEWLTRATGSPLENRFREAWILDHGRRERWRALLAVQPEEPLAAKLQCYWWRAKLATGARDEAMAAAARLWNVGVSQDKACDPLFAEWMTDAPPDDALVWARALRAFDARSSQLLRYLTRFASPELLPLLQELYAVYRYPDRLAGDAHQPDPRHAQLMTVGIRRLARFNPELARKALDNARDQQPFTDQQLQAMESMIVRHSLFAQTADPGSWLDETLARLRDDGLTAIHLRNLIRDSEWQRLLVALEWLSADVAQSDQWRWWQGRALQATGHDDEAEVIWRRLAAQRSFHGFLAADYLGLPYALNESPMVPADGVVDDPGLARVRELHALGRVSAARVEWNLLLARSEPDQQQWLSIAARDAGWRDFAVAAANAAKAWDALSERFPWLYREAFEHSAATLGVSAGELVAIARRESALYPGAVSPVGAMGLMQLMPSTARQVARKAGKTYRRQRLLDPEFNIDLGARYYTQLKSRFNEVRPLALAAYNAGPHRVDRWQQGSMAVDQWIDSLPFRETREYVRAVLSYNLIYRLRAGESARLLSERERRFQY